MNDMTWKRASSPEKRDRPVASPAILAAGVAIALGAAIHGASGQAEQPSAKIPPWVSAQAADSRAAKYVNYLRLTSTAADTDDAGFLIESVRADVRPPR